ncbi:ATP-grasp domain-containing protein [Pseudogracilibacillus sp. ICA-222130]|uniref:ATP-grasp domain-containing protein n=1 Tax=Pseudogracilibacillus sp. ICA-222130 TaxID=3134655 RepID=UPI0030C1FFEB
MKKILIVGSGFLQSFIIKKAKEMGLYTIALDKNNNAIGFKYADEHYCIDIVNEYECLKVAKQLNIDGVVTGATDYGVLSTSFISEKMNLPGLAYKTTELIKDKHKVRSLLSTANINDVKQFYTVDKMSNFKNISRQLKYPVMIKPIDGSGSRGAYKVNEEKDFIEFSKLSIENSAKGVALVEDFIEGREYGVESFVYGGKVYVLSILGKIMTDHPNYAELGHYTISDKSVEFKIKKKVEQIINVLEIDYGSVNMDVIVDEQNNVSVIDIGVRMGGNLIGSHIIPLSTGFPYIENIIRASLGEKIDTHFAKNRKEVATRVIALKPGEIKKIPNISEIEKEYNVNILHTLKEGKFINEYQNNLDGLGYIISSSKNVQEAMLKNEKALQVLNKKIIRK